MAHGAGGRSVQSRGSVSDRQQISNCARSSGTRSIIKARSSSYFLHPHGRCNQVGYAHMGPASETNEDIRALFQPCPPPLPTSIWHGGLARARVSRALLWQQKSSAADRKHRPRGSHSLSIRRQLRAGLMSRPFPPSNRFFFLYILTRRSIMP